MAGARKPSALGASELKMADARKLVAIGSALTNERSRSHHINVVSQAHELGC